MHPKHRNGNQRQSTTISKVLFAVWVTFMIASMEIPIARLPSRESSLKTAAALDSSIKVAELKKKDDIKYNREQNRMDVNATLRDLPWISKEVANAYASTRGITHLYPWQARALRELHRNSTNMVFTLPTSAGKTLLAEIAILRCCIKKNKTALLVLPYVALVLEKLSALTTIAKHAGLYVAAYHGPHGQLPPLRRPGILVATPEKATAIVNSLITAKDGNRSIYELGLVILDEIQMVGEWKGDKITSSAGGGGGGSRGGLDSAATTIVGQNMKQIGGGGNLLRGQTLELLASLLIWHGNRRDLQVLAMSATLANTKEIATWFRGSIFEGGFRPVPLRQFLKAGVDIYNSTGHRVRALTTDKGINHARRDLNGVMDLIREVTRENKKVLIFCSSRSAAKACAEMVAKHGGAECSSCCTTIKRDKGKREVSLHDNDENNNLRGGNDMMKSSSSSSFHCCEKDKYKRGIRHDLNNLITEAEEGLEYNATKDMILKGVGYHHAGIGPVARALIEDGYRRSVLSILCATSTLAAGVNLPASRVIFRTPYIGSSFLDAQRYRQMGGRAGRAGYSDVGDSYILVRPSSRDYFRSLQLMKEDLPPVKSGLLVVSGYSVEFSNEKKKRGRNKYYNVPVGMLQAVLIAITALNAQSVEDVERFLKCTLLAVQADNSSIKILTETALDWLGDNGFLARARTRIIGQHHNVASIKYFVPMKPRGEGRDDRDHGLNEENLSEGSSAGGLISADHQHFNVGNPTKVKTSRLAWAAFKAAIPPYQAVDILRDLRKIVRSVVLVDRGCLHLCYLCAQANDVIHVNYTVLHQVLGGITSHTEATAAAVAVNTPPQISEGGGVGNECSSSSHGTSSSINSNGEAIYLVAQQLELTDKFITSQMRGKTYSSLAQKLHERASRLYVALILSETVQEADMKQISKKFHVSYGDIQNLMQTAASHGHRVSRFCEELSDEFWHLGTLLRSFIPRIYGGVRREVADLTLIPYLGGQRARRAYDAGLKSIRDVASCPLSKLRGILRIGSMIATRIKVAAQALVIQEAQSMADEIDELNMIVDNDDARAAV